MDNQQKKHSSNKKVNMFDSNLGKKDELEIQDEKNEHGSDSNSDSETVSLEDELT